MSNVLFDNNAATTLGAACGTTDTTLTLAVGTGAGFPSPSSGQYFALTIWAAGSTTGIPNEIVYVTNRTGDTLTVIRAREGTAAQSWAVGAFAGNLITAAVLQSFASITDVQTQSDNYAADTGAANAGVIALNPALTSLTPMVGAPIRVLKITSANTGAYTLNVNGLGAQPVTFQGAPLTSGMLPASEIFEVFWDGTAFELLSPPAQLPNAALAVMAAYSFKANVTGSTAEPTDASVLSVLGVLGFAASTLTNPAGFFVIPVVYGGAVVELYVQWVTQSFPDVPAGGVGYDGTVSWPTPFPTLCLPPMICTEAVAGNISNWNASVTSYNQTTVGYQVQEWAASYNPGTVIIWGIGH